VARLVHVEALPVFYSINTFYLDSGELLQPGPSDTTAFQLIRNLELSPQPFEFLSFPKIDAEPIDVLAVATQCSNALPRLRKLTIDCSLDTREAEFPSLPHAYAEHRIGSFVELLKHAQHAEWMDVCFIKFQLANLPLTVFVKHRSIYEPWKMVRDKHDTALDTAGEG
jgi:hypothetical protein